MHLSHSTPLASTFSFIAALISLGYASIEAFSSQHSLISIERQNEINIHFDDLSVPKAGLIEPPNPYHHLTFSSFSVFSPHSPAFSHIIHPADYNCAVSNPNALLGSRTSEKGAPASFEIANEASLIEEGSKPTFTLQKMTVKPMAAPEPGTNFTVKGYREKNEVLEWSVWFPSGFHEMFEVKIEDFSKKKWEGLRKVEISADFGYDGLDWEFCVDDLVVDFKGIGKGILSE